MGKVSSIEFLPVVYQHKRVLLSKSMGTTRDVSEKSLDKKQLETGLTVFLKYSIRYAEHTHWT